MNDDNVILQNQHGAYEVDIVGMMHLLKTRKIPVGSFVVSLFADKNTHYLLDAYTVCQSVHKSHVLMLEEDMEEAVEKIKQLPGMGLTEIDFSSSGMDDFSDILGLDYDDEFDDFLMDESSMYLELDDLSMDALYMIYTPEVLKKAEEKPEAPHRSIIHYEEALHRLKNGENVYLDYGPHKFSLVTPKHTLSPDAVLTGVWAISTEAEKGPTDSTQMAAGDLNERLGAFLESVTPEGEQSETVEELKHDAEMDALLRKLKDLFKKE